MAPRPRGNTLPIDESVTIPKAVRDAAAAADAHYNPPSGDPPAEPPVAPVEPPPADPTPPAPTPPVTPPGNDEARFGPVDSATAEEWRSRFVSENGRYRAKLRVIEQHEQTISGLENIIESMRQQLEVATATPPAPPAPASFITDKEREDFGEEMLDVVGKRAREILSPEVEALKATVADLTNRLNGTARAVEQTTQEQMLAKLTEAVPNWEEINFDKKFKSWLALPDPFSGVIRQKLLTQSFEQNQTPRVIAFFKGFLSEEAALDPSPGTQVAPAAPQPPKVNLEDLAAPGRARTPASGSSLPVEKPIILTSQIKAFYDLVRAGGYAGREEEKDGLEREIFAAQRDGRVRTG